MNVETIRDAWVIVKATGEIDLSNVSELRDAVDSALESSPEGFIIDLTDLTYIDSAGVAVVISAYRHASKLGGRLAVVKPSAPNVQRILDLIGLDMLPNIIVTRDTNTAKMALSAADAQASRE